MEELLLILDMYYTKIPKKQFSTAYNMDISQLKKKKKEVETNKKFH